MTNLPKIKSARRYIHPIAFQALDVLRYRY